MWSADKHGAPNSRGLSTGRVRGHAQAGEHDGQSCKGCPAKCGGAMQNADEHDAPDSRGFLPGQSLGACGLLLSTICQTPGDCPPAKPGGVRLASMHDASDSQRLSFGKVWGHAEVAAGRVLCSPEHHEKALVICTTARKAPHHVSCTWVSSCKYYRSSGEHES